MSSVDIEEAGLEDIQAQLFAGKISAWVRGEFLITRHRATPWLASIFFLSVMSWKAPLREQLLSELSSPMAVLAYSPGKAKRGLNDQKGTSQTAQYPKCWHLLYYQLSTFHMN